MSRNALIPPTRDEIAQREADEARLRAEAVAKIEHAYRFGATVLGEEEADRTWRKVAAKPGGRPPGPKAPDHDRELLRFHDLAMKKMEPRPTLASIGKFLYEMTGDKFGHSAEAIATRLRRLLKKREARLREQRELGNLCFRNDKKASTFNVAGFLLFLRTYSEPSNAIHGVARMGKSARCPLTRLRINH